MTPKYIFLDIDGVLNSHRMGEDAFRRDNSDNSLYGANISLPPVGEEHIEHFNRIIERTGAEIVISSSWRKLGGAGTDREDIHGVRWVATAWVGILALYLQHKGLKGKILGATPIMGRNHSGEMYYRGHEIARWLEQKTVRPPFNADPEGLVEGTYGHDLPRVSFVILDDDSDMVYLSHRLVKTTMVDGLQPEHVERAVLMLNEGDL